jgi:hypothetical protein
MASQDIYYNNTNLWQVSRKPVPDDGRSIRSRKSHASDPFSERPGSSGIIRTPTNFELSLKDDMSIEASEEIFPGGYSRKLIAQET